MRLPIVNVEEKIDKIVGKRTQPADPFAAGISTKRDSIAWREAFGGVRVPRGIHRFRTHEEADDWLWRMITRQPPRI